MTETEVRNVVRTFQKEDIPLDAVYLDIDYMDGFRVFTHDSERFSDIPRLVRDIHETGVRVVPIVDPGVKIDPKYKFYCHLKENGKVLQQYDGKDDLVAHVWPGKCVLPDFFDETTCTLWAHKQAEWMRQNCFDGVWNDMNEPSNFDGANEKTSRALCSGGDLREVYNLYGKRMAETSGLGCVLADESKRPFVITRSGYPGVHRSAVIWHGDNQAWWEHLQLALQTAVTYSLCGAYYTGADVPGFTGNPPGDLAVRFFQLGAFLPFYRGHSIYFAEDKEPYAFKEPYRSEVVNAIRLRYSFLREWYSYFEKSVRERRPLLQPVFREKTLVPDQFMLFEKLLVAPVLTRDEEVRKVYLPRGEWYRLGKTENVLRGHQHLLEDVTLGSIPVYVRAGSVVVRNQIGANSEATLQAEEQCEIYGDKNGEASGYWYGDDGLSRTPVEAERYLLQAKGEVVKRIKVQS